MARRKNSKQQSITKRQKKINADLAKDEKRLATQNDKLYKNTGQKIVKNVSEYFAKYGENGKIPYQKMMSKMTSEELSDLIQEIQSWNLKNSGVRGIVLPSTNINKLEGLFELNNIDIMKMAPEEQERLTKHLTNLTTNVTSAWKQESNIFSKEFGNVNIDDVIQSRWLDGDNFSDRIWKNKDRLTKTLNTKLRDALIRGDDLKKISQDIRKTFRVKAREARRLVFTEGSYILNETKARMMANISEYYIIETMNDDKVCPICQAMEGERFRFEDRNTGQNFPPFHPSCRCSFTVVD